MFSSTHDAMRPIIIARCCETAAIRQYVNSGFPIVAGWLNTLPG
jgi:hypothetical protein